MSIHVEHWAPERLSLASGGLEREELFALTLRHFLGSDDEQFWRGLRLIVIGLEQLSKGDRTMAAALTTAGFEALFPVAGREDVSAQFRGIGSMLVPHERMTDWFKDLYEIRCGILHGSEVSGKGGKKRMPRLIRDIELARTVFQYCALQLDGLAFDERRIGTRVKTDDDEDDLTRHLMARRYWYGTISDRIKWDNQQLCRTLRQKKWDAKSMRGFLFDPDDSSASRSELLVVGARLLSLFVEVLDSAAVVREMNREPIPTLRRFFRHGAVENESSIGTGENWAGLITRIKQLAVNELSVEEFGKGLSWLGGNGLNQLAANMTERDSLDLANDLAYFLLALGVTMRGELPTETGIHTDDGHELVESWREVISAWNVLASEMAASPDAPGQ